jgi:predicted dehydrogenase
MERATKVKIYTAAVVGLGRVGASYPEDNIPRTHFGAYQKHPRFNTVAVVDINSSMRDAFSRQWPDYRGAIYASVADMLVAVKPEVISVCVPPSIMPSVTAELVASNPSFLFLEKPLAENREGANLLKQILARAEPAVAVNYHRLWDPAHDRFFARIKEAGNPVTIRVVYGKGLYNYASHLVALLIAHFGQVRGVTPLPDLTNRDHGDSSVSFIVHFEKGFSAHFVGVNDVAYDLLELEVFTRNTVFSLTAGGCRRRTSRPVNGLFYPGYSQLAEDSQEEPDSIVEGLFQALGNIAAHLDNTAEPLRCDLSVGLAVLDVLFAAKPISKLN